MAQHRRTTSVVSTRSRRVLGGAAMTAVFLGGGAGVAMANPAQDAADAASEAVSNTGSGSGTGAGSGSGSTGSGLGDLLPGGVNVPVDVTPRVNAPILSPDSINNNGDGNTLIRGDGNTVIEHTDNSVTNNHYYQWKKAEEKKKEDERKEQDRKDRERHNDRHHNGDDCDRECDETDDKKTDDDCDDETEATKSAPKKEKETEIETVAAVSDTGSDSEVKGVAVDAIGADIISPSGSADAGDGSFLPAASSSTFSATDAGIVGGGLAAAALLAGAGLGMGRHRRGASQR